MTDIITDLWSISYSVHRWIKWEKGDFLSPHLKLDYDPTSFEIPDVKLGELRLAMNDPMENLSDKMVPI